MRCSIEQAFRRPQARMAQAAPAGSSPQPAPPLESEASLPAVLSLGPPATVLGGTNVLPDISRLPSGGSPQTGSLSSVRGFGPAMLNGTSPAAALDLTLLHDAEAVYGPELLEERNLLLAGNRIVGLLDDGAADTLRASLSGLGLSTLDCSGCIITPGFVDCHVHITGGGGEAGPASRYGLQLHK